ncbi:MAG: glycine--tRNA ligase subunit beta [Pseudomonadota bacterium]
MSTRDFLVEIGTEELPPKSLPALSAAFSEGILAALAAAGIRHGKVERYAAPRRLALLVRRVAEHQLDQQIKRKGPPVSASFTPDGQPTRAASAFAESCGTTLAALGRITEPKGEFLFHTGVKAGAATITLLEGIVTASLDKLPIAKRMRWGAGTAEFVRPVHWIVLLYGREIVPATILGITASDRTRGHRFMAPKEIRLSSPASYAGRLEKAGRVIADFARRRELIREGVTRLATEHGGRAIIGDALLDEVTALVEWPSPIAGRFEERFLALPREVLIATLQDHQRYFPVEDAGSQLTSLFITVANIVSRAPDEVRRGNERVVRPRLADAAFFWDQDCRTPLAARREQLKAVTFQAQLGSYFAKSERVRALALELAPQVGAEAADAARAAELAKCDLLTGLVGEFPELQGTMGAYYARHDGEAAAVATALGEQYLPRYAGDALPATPTGTALALADKLDTIVGAFAIGQKPTGAKDPFAVRRATLGVLRIVLERRLELDVPALVAGAMEAIRADLNAQAAARTDGKPPAALPDSAVVGREVYDYAFERLRAYYLEAGEGISTEMFDAVLDRRPGSPLDFDARLRALGAFLALPDAAALSGANKRIANILRKANHTPAAAVRAELFEGPEERALAEAIAALTPGVEARLAERDYAAALKQLATLRPAVDAFFDKVMVMAEDPAVRANRLTLLGSMQRLFLEIADLSRLPG